MSDTFTVVFRDGSVVESRLIEAETFAKAAKKAQRLTDEGGKWAGWSVYSLTRGVTGGAA